MNKTSKTKYCPTCKTIRDVSLFYKNRSNKSGIGDYCKFCIKEMSKKYTSTPEAKEYQRLYQKVYQKEYYKNNKVKIKAYQKRYYRERRDAIKPSKNQ